MLRSSPGASPSSATELAAAAAGSIAKDRAGKRKFPPIRRAAEQSYSLGRRGERPLGGGWAFVAPRAERLLPGLSACSRAKRLLAAADASAGGNAVTAGTLISGCGAGARAILSPWLGYPPRENAQRQPPTLTRSSARALDRPGSLRARRARSRASFDSPSAWAPRAARLTPAQTSRDRFGPGGRPSR